LKDLLSRVVLESRSRHLPNGNVTATEISNYVECISVSIQRGFSCGGAGGSVISRHVSHHFSSSARPLKNGLSGRHMNHVMPSQNIWNTGWKRLFSSEPPPRRGWEKFYPKGRGRRPAQEKKATNGASDFFLLCARLQLL
jgi:hypothetical protein